MLRKESEEILESLELEGVAIERLPQLMHASGTPGYRFIAISELSDTDFCVYSRGRLYQLCTDGRISNFRIHGKYFLNSYGVSELMDYEEQVLSGEIKTRGSRPKEKRGQRKS
jgi:hypothetical protein